MLSKNVAKLSGCNMGHAVAARLFLPRGVPSIRAKALSRTKISSAVPSTAFFAREVEDRDSENLTLNHISVEDRFHQPSIRPSTSTMILLDIPPYAGCESAQSTTCGLACADQGQPRAALDRRKIKPTLDVSCFLRPSPRRSSSVLPSIFLAP